MLTGAVAGAVGAVVIDAVDVATHRRLHDPADRVVDVFSLHAEALRDLGRRETRHEVQTGDRGVVGLFRTRRLPFEFHDRGTYRFGHYRRRLVTRIVCVAHPELVAEALVNILKPYTTRTSLGPLRESIAERPIERLREVRAEPPARGPEVAEARAEYVGEIVAPVGLVVEASRNSDSSGDVVGPPPQLAPGDLVALLGHEGKGVKRELRQVVRMKRSARSGFLAGFHAP